MAALAPTASSSLQSLRYSRGSLEILDQLLVPTESTYVPVLNAEDGWGVIRRMQVRGAPLIAIVASLALAVEASKIKGISSGGEAASFLLDKMTYLRTSRPTAVNLFTATDLLKQVVTNAATATGATADSVFASYIKEAESMLAADVADNRSIGKHGADEFLTVFRDTLPENQRKPDDETKLKILTICNTGSLATAGYGTALGVIRALAERGSLDHVYACETRPYNQGSRLTAFEIVEEQLPGTLICDSAVSALMAIKGVDGVVAGADRVCRNGDTANKIGTYNLAIAAKYHGVPFYIAAPRTTIDLALSTGAEIQIEERGPDELRSIRGVPIAPPTVDVWNPVFDVTPAALISGIITEFGVVKPTNGIYDIEQWLIDLQSSGTE